MTGRGFSLVRQGSANLTQAWYPFYWSDYSGKTMHLTQGQHGAFMLLMRWIYTTEKPIPHKQRFSIARAVLEHEQSNVDEVLSEFFTKDGEFWHNDRCIEVIASANAKHEKRVNAGKKGGKAKAVNASSNATAMLYQPESQPEPYKLDTNVSNTPTPKGLPDWLPVPDWRDFCQMRGTRFTARAKQLVIGKLEKLKQEGYDPAAVLQQSLERGWSGVFPIKGDYHGSNQITPRQASRGNGGVAGEQNGNGFGGRKSQTQLASEETARIIRERRARWEANGGKNPDQGLPGITGTTQPAAGPVLLDAEKVR